MTDPRHAIWFTGAAAPLPPPPPSIRAEVAIVGGGFTGLTAALHLARRGIGVTVLEAGTVAMGASGVNAGFVVPNFAKADPDAVTARLGRERGEKLLRMVGTGADRVFATIRDEAIACDAEQVGWMHIAHSPEMVPMLARRVEARNALGRPLRLLSAPEARALTAARHCHGALFDPSGGMLDPLAYARGLAAAAIRAGATVHEQAAVRTIIGHGGGWKLEGHGFEVQADRVLLCTNAGRGGAAARLGRRTVPLRVYQIATEPLSPELAARISPRRIPFADTRSNLFTARLDRDNRLISGGMAVFPPGAEARLSRRIAERLAAEFSLPAPPPMAAAWQGTAAMTMDFLPHVYTFGPGFWGGIGCNGRGVALTAMLGEVLADIASGTPVAETPVPPAGADLPLPRAATSLAASLAVAQARWRDRREGL